MLKKTITALAMALALPALPVLAQDAMPPMTAATAPAEPDAIPLYGADTPGSAASENWILFGGSDLAVRNVTRPTLTPVLPDPARANGAAVIVAPGGAFMLLSWDHEGTRVARALADRGIAAFILKYRLLETPADNAAAMGFMNAQMAAGLADPTKPPTLQNPLATQDALAALAMVRARASEWHVDPARVGMIGFSAGAMTTLNTVLAAGPGQGPDFIGYIYGPQPAVVVPDSAPPMFAAIAMDDQLFSSQGFPIVEAWHGAGRPVELHAYERGGHGFGLGVPGMTNSLVFDQFTAWMAMHGLLEAQASR